MKKIICNKWILPFAFLILLAGCKRDNLLDKFPPDAFTEPTYFKTENDLKYYANSFYGSLPTQFPNNDDNSDNMAPRSLNTLLAGNYTVPSTGGGWGVLNWTGIRRCNYFLARYSRAETHLKERYAAEVRFFRALYYWEKVKNFGDVPLVLADLNENSEELYGPRVPHKQVMDKVLEDLNFAVANLPTKSEAAAGRLHKDAANTLKSRICLWEGTFRKYHKLGDENIFLTEAVNSAEAIINTGIYEIYSTGKPNEDYRNLFIQKDLSGNKEAIMARIFLKDISTHDYTRTSGENNTGLSKSSADAYLFTDGKPIGVTSFSYDDSTPEKEALNRDPRYAQTIAIPGFVWTEPNQIVQLPAIGTSRTSTGYWNIKARSSDPLQWIAGQSDLDAFIFRYAEVLLNYAEAKYELAGTLTQAELDKSINKLRARVAMPNLTPNPAVDPNADDFGYPVTPLLYEIRRERRIELMGEGFRFNDMLRWKAGKLIESTKSIRGMKLTDQLRAKYTYDISKITVDADNYIIVYPTFATKNRVWNDKMYLYPLPTEEIKLYNYKQNPGW